MWGSWHGLGDYGGRLALFGAKLQPEFAGGFLSFSWFPTPSKRLFKCPNSQSLINTQISVGLQLYLHESLF
jgi:hypothetical protein